MTPLLIGAALLLLILPKAIARVRLSRAKHRSLAGHARVASRVVAWLPALDYPLDGFFRVDGAPAEVENARKHAFFRLSELLQQRQPQSQVATREAMPVLSDLQLTSRYRVPVPFSRVVRSHLPAAPFARATHGARLEDLDGNHYLDLTGSYGVNVLGNDFYKRCIDEGVTKARELGCVLGYYHPVTVANATRLAAISGLDEVTFHMSGTEAVMQAVRLARYHTRRSHVVRFCGAYHGWWGEVQPGPGNPEPASRTYTLRDMDERSLDILRTRRDIACVLINPLQALHPNKPAPGDSALLAGRQISGAGRAAYGEWLRAVRAACDERGIALIFDEVFTGFRLARGGAQELFGVRADLVTYGKTVGGGLPVGVVCGKHAFMRRFREDHPADLCFARGTFNAHPYVMGSMSAFLDAFDSPEVVALYTRLDERWDNRAAHLNEALAQAALPVRVANLGSIWTVEFARASRYNWMLQYYLRANKLALSWVGSGRLIFSLDFSDEDFAEVVESFTRAAKAMDEDGWFWAPAEASNGRIARRVLFDMARARLGFLR